MMAQLTQIKSGSCPPWVEQPRVRKQEVALVRESGGVPISPPAPLLGSLPAQPWLYGTPTPQNRPELLRPRLPPEHPQEAVVQPYLSDNTSARP